MARKTIAAAAAGLAAYVACWTALAFLKPWLATALMAFAVAFFLLSATGCGRAPAPPASGEAKPPVSPAPPPEAEAARR